MEHLLAVLLGAGLAGPPDPAGAGAGAGAGGQGDRDRASAGGPIGFGGSGASDSLPLPLAALLAGAMGNGAMGISDSPQDRPRGGNLVLLSVPGRGIVGAALAPGGQESGSPFPMGFPLGLLGGMFQFPGSSIGGDSENTLEAAGNPLNAMMEQIARVILERSMQESSPSVPPANESVRDALPRVVVTMEDMIDSSNSKCAVCLEEYRVGCRATRMLCGHLFCTSCIREWLRGANSCPVCRYELATDQAEFETGRKQRMCGRLARLRAAEMRMLRVPELRKLMRALEVSGDGCVEKADLVLQLANAPGVEVLPEVELGGFTEHKLRYEAGDLRTLELPLLHNLMERHRVPCSSQLADLSEDEERHAVLQGFAASGLLRDSSIHESKGMLRDSVPSNHESKGKGPPVDLTLSLSAGRSTEASESESLVSSAVVPVAEPLAVKESNDKSRNASRSVCRRQGSGSPSGSGKGRKSRSSSRNPEKMVLRTSSHKSRSSSRNPEAESRRSGSGCSSRDRSRGKLEAAPTTDTVPATSVSTPTRPRLPAPAVRRPVMNRTARSSATTGSRILQDD